MAKLEREIDRLFELPLDEFTTKRNELARRLKQDGDKEAAEQVQTLDKPSVPAWTINQLARQQKASVKALLDAGAKLRKAQERALAGGRSDVLRAAQTEERRAVRDLTQRAEKILKAAERPASRATLERISATLGAAAVTEPARKALKAGRLTSEVKVTGFDALAGLDVPETARRPDELAERRQQKADTERRRKLQKTARELEDRATAAERKAEEAEEAAAEARQDAEEQRRAADAVASELAELLRKRG